MTLPAAAARAPAASDLYLLPAPGLRQSRRCALTPAADMDRKAAAIDGTDGRTDGHPTVT